jgi:hypothetical protein
MNAGAAESARIREILEAANKMAQHERETRQHIEHRQRLATRQRPAADQAFMTRLAGTDERFWELVHRAFAYARDSMRLSEKIIRDADQLRERR